MKSLGSSWTCFSILSANSCSSQVPRPLRFIPKAKPPETPAESRCGGVGNGCFLSAFLKANGPVSIVPACRAKNEYSTPYAVKVLHPQRQNDPVAREMLRREAQVAAAVRHPHLIAILDAQLTRQLPFLLMPWLEGASLETYTKARRLFDPPAVLWIAADGRGPGCPQSGRMAAWRHQAGKYHHFAARSRDASGPRIRGIAAIRPKGPASWPAAAIILPRNMRVPAAFPTSAATSTAWVLCSTRYWRAACHLKARRWSNWSPRHKVSVPLHLRRAAPHVPPRGRSCAANAGQRPLAAPNHRRSWWRNWCGLRSTVLASERRSKLAYDVRARSLAAAS